MPDPEVKPPPNTNTSTGRKSGGGGGGGGGGGDCDGGGGGGGDCDGGGGGGGGGVIGGAGDQMLSWRHASEVGSVAPTCGHMGPKAVASNTLGRQPVVFGCGGLNLNCLIG